MRAGDGARHQPRRQQSSVSECWAKAHAGITGPGARRAGSHLLVLLNWSCACVLSHFSRVRLCATLWTVACQAPLSVGFSRQEYWSGLPCPPSGDLPDPEIEPMSFTSPGSAGGFFTTRTSFQILELIGIQIPVLNFLTQGMTLFLAVLTIGTSIPSSVLWENIFNLQCSCES